MKLLRLSALLAATALLATACKREAEVTVDNPLLAYVPPDTPYVYANLEPTPGQIVDAYLLRAGPMLDAAQTLLGDLQVEISADEPGELSRARLVRALLTEFDGKLNRAGLESLGLSLESQVVVYGAGVFPVARIALKDPEALRAAIARVEQNSGVPFTTHRLGETNYWRVSAQGNGPAAYFAIIENHFAFGIFLPAAEAEWLPAFLGQTLPENPTAAAQLAALNKDKGYTGFGSGFADLQKLATEFFDPNSRTASLLADLGHAPGLQLDAQCKAEIQSIIAKAPRIVTGTTELTADRIGLSYQLELEGALAAKLAELVAEVPVADSDPSKMFSAALGLKMGRLRDFAREQFTAIASTPYQCAQLQHLNQQASAALEQLNQPLPPFVNNLKGFRVSLDEFDLANFEPRNVRGLFSLEMEKPQMVIGMAQMFLPGMENLTLEPGADPVALPQELLSFAADGLQVYAAMGHDSIGIALGESKQEDLQRFMAADAANRNVFFSLEYDMAAQLELQQRMQQQISNQDDAPAAHEEFARALQDAYKAWLGRSRLEVSFEPDGIRMDTSISFR